MQATTSSTCASSALSTCQPAHCRRQCALEAIDALLSGKRAVRGDEVDGLLDLRWHLRRADDAEAALRLFCDLRLRMEQQHYLAFFRIRRWLENHLIAHVRTHTGPLQERTVSVQLNYYCVEAIRRASLCKALGRQDFSSVPRLQFAFRNPGPTGSTKTSALASATL